MYFTRARRMFLAAAVLACGELGSVEWPKGDGLSPSLIRDGVVISVSTARAGEAGGPDLSVVLPALSSGITSPGTARLLPKRGPAAGAPQTQKLRRRGVVSGPRSRPSRAMSMCATMRPPQIGEPPLERVACALTRRKPGTGCQAAVKVVLPEKTSCGLP